MASQTQRQTTTKKKKKRRQRQAVKRPKRQRQQPIQRTTQTANAKLIEEGKEARPVYYSGISDLKLPWIELEDATQWDSCPVGSVIVIDECQRVFRPRSSGAQVPTYISALETHRHKGFDLFLVTQHPMLVDQNIRRLVGQHWHVVRKFGLQMATINEWGSVHEITQRNLLQAVRRQFKYSKEIFDYYKSAEMHTHKAKVPMRVWFMVAAPILIAAFAYYGYQKMMHVGKKEAPESVAAATASPGQTNAQNQPMTIAEYYEQGTPRIAGLQHTAPKYDELTRPTDAPFPSACMISKGFDRDTGKHFDKCGCIDQQGNRYAAGPSLCRDIALNGIFKDFGEQKVAVREERPAREAVPKEPPVQQPEPVSVTG